MTMVTSSRSETINFGETNDSQYYKLVRLVRTLRMEWTYNPTSEINIYAYINEFPYNNARQKDERESISQRIGYVLGALRQMGVPDAQVYVAGIAFSSNRAGAIDLSIRDGKSTFILPPYPPAVSPSTPKEPSAQREKWLNPDAEIGVDPKERKIEVEVGVKYEGDPITKIIQPALKCVFRADGSLKAIGAEINLLKAEIAEKIAGFRNVEIAAKTVGSIEFSKTDAERYRTELQAKFKAELSANIPIPGTQPYNPEKKENLPEKQTKIPIKLSIDIDPKGELGVSALITVIEF